MRFFSALAAGAAAFGTTLKAGGSEHSQHILQMHKELGLELESLGNTNDLVRTFGKSIALPIGEKALAEAGWHKGECVPGMGYIHTEDPRGPVHEKPMALYTTKGGAMSGISVQIRGEPAALAGKMDYFTKVGVENDEGKSTYTLEVSTRSVEDPCSSEEDAADIGDRVLVAPNGAKKVISLDEADMEANSRRGSCFDSMGFHRFIDLQTGTAEMTWNKDNLAPIVPMYHEGKLNAIFFLTFDVQQGWFNANEWEPIPLVRPAFCLNTCDGSECRSQSGTASTFHVYFNDPETVKCDREVVSCTLPGMGCCPKKDALMV